MKFIKLSTPNFYMEETIRIPEDRLGVLIGPNGKVKRELQAKTNTIIEIDSELGEVTCSGEGENFFKALDIIKAIGRGFSPERAFTLLNEDYLLKIVELREYVGTNESAQKAKRGRVIGRQGQARKNLEQKTNSLISVQGKTVAIIAKVNDIEAATDAVVALLGGASHDTVTNQLERRGKERFEL